MRARRVWIKLRNLRFTGARARPRRILHYLIRTHGDPMAMARTLRVKVHELEPGRSVFNVMPLEDHLDDKLAENRLRTILLTLFAATAISLVVSDFTERSVMWGRCGSGRWGCGWRLVRCRDRLPGAF